MASVSVTIIKVTDDGTYPMWAEAQLTDRFGEVHIFRDKLPIFMAHDPTEIPCEGIIGCRVTEERDGYCIVDTSLPDDVEDDEGRTRFEVDKGLVSMD